MPNQANLRKSLHGCFFRLLELRRSRHFSAARERLSCEFHFFRLCRDAHRKLQFWLDLALLHVTGTSRQIKAPLAGQDRGEVQYGKFRMNNGGRDLVCWEGALPSRLVVQTPCNIEQQLETAKTAYRRFGQYSRALDQIRLFLEHRVVERAELQRMCVELRIPSDFDIAQISWRPDYDPFFYDQLSRRARRIYLFRGEYIFDLEKAVVVETPQLGHATYVFSRPRSIQGFLVLYIKTTKEDIRRNRDNVGERLGFLGRVIHGMNPRVWLKEMQHRLGEKLDFASSVPE